MSADRYALITGASSGLGAEFAQQLAALRPPSHFGGQTRGQTGSAGVDTA